MSNVDPTDIDAQAAELLEKKQAKTRNAIIRESDLRRLMSSKWGRRIVWRLLEDSGVFRLSFDENAISMAFNEGNRNLGNQYLAEITSLCPDRYIEMLKEQQTNGSKHRNTN